MRSLTSVMCTFVHVWYAEHSSVWCMGTVGLMAEGRGCRLSSEFLSQQWCATMQRCCVQQAWQPRNGRPSASGTPWPRWHQGTQFRCRMVNAQLWEGREMVWWMCIMPRIIACRTCMCYRSQVHSQQCTSAATNVRRVCAASHASLAC